MFEETGLKANKLEFIGIIDDFNGAAHDHWVTINFLCEDFEGEPKAMEPEKIADWRWVPIDDLPDGLWGLCEGTVKCFLAEEMYLQT